MITFLMVLTASFVFGTTNQLQDDFKLPNSWEKNFGITLSHHGSMNGGFTDLRFTYDSCVYLTGSNNDGTKKRVYLMTEKDRASILEKLRGLKIESIKAKDIAVTVDDGWSQSICFGTHGWQTTFHCIEGGTSVELEEKDKNSFLDAYRYLESFAMEKGKKVRK